MRPWIIFIPVASAVAVLLACSKGVSTAPPPDVDSGTEDDVVFGDDAAPEAQPDGEGEGDGGGDGQVDASAPDAAACDASSVDGGRVVAYAPLSLRSTYDFTSIDYSIVTHVVEHAVCTNGDGTLNLTNLGGTFLCRFNTFLQVRQPGTSSATRPHFLNQWLQLPAPSLQFAFQATPFGL